MSMPSDQVGAPGAKRSRTLLVVFLLALPACLAGCAGSARTRAAEAPREVASADGRFVPDEPLVEGMSRVKAAADVLARGSAEGPDPARVREHADAIAQAVDTIFAKCHLEPEPDAALHPLLARLLGAVSVLREDPGDAAAVASIQRVVADYQGLFGALP